MNRSKSKKEARILLIEDDASFASLVGLALDDQNFPYALTTLDDGVQALAFVRRQGRYARSAGTDLIVMDLHLPKRGGVEILTAIRGSAEFADVPVVILTGSESPEERRSVDVFRATCFLQKPRDLEELSHVGNKLRILAQEGMKGRVGRAESPGGGRLLTGYPSVACDRSQHAQKNREAR